MSDNNSSAAGHGQTNGNDPYNTPTSDAATPGTPDGSTVSAPLPSAYGTGAGYDASASAYTQRPAGEQKSWLVTVLLCFFLGELGVHNFYIGQQKTGTIQLVVYCVAFLIGVLTLGIGFILLLPSVIWKFIDLFKLLTGAVSTDAQGVPLQR
ncbi:TM2 domain-containing protein [Corynebacterium pygosceleis]|uniref:TM2 domain-containing protein n=1 Tax=Corynebacterium pygosceleis TaxID=2800406 RepID=UPI00190796F4|nr:TM2 domain-containing protein [Corynebacterium pygosceleis]MCK7675235.1 TM2 domain-containing protein [Corynebacterium pygosceleis]MCL0120550.1 TM2 domain-containing protein [Corynebacterium pygosceleis]